MTKSKTQKKTVLVRGDGLFLLFALGCLTATLLFSRDLADISNMPRYVALSVTLVVMSFVKCRWSMWYLPAVLFAVWQFASIGWATNRAESLFDASCWFMVVAVAFLVAKAFREKSAHSVVLLARLSAILFVISAAVALSQVSQLGDLSWNSRYSVVSLYTHKGTFAMMTLLMMVFPLMYLSLPLRRRWTYLLLVAAGIAMLVFLQARSAIMALVAMIVSTLLLFSVTWVGKKRHGSAMQRQNKSVRWIVSIVLAIIMTAAVVEGCRWFAAKEFPGPDQSGGIRSNASIYERQSLWRVTLRLADDSPLIGCGAGNWKVCYPKAGVEDIFSVDVLDLAFIRPHNEYLRLFAETGYVGLYLFLLPLCLLAVSVLFRLTSIKRLHRLKVGLRSRLIIVAASAVVAIMVFALFDFPFDRMELLLWCSIVIGSCSGLVASDTPRRFGNRVSLLPTLLLSLFCLLIGMLRLGSERKYKDIVLAVHERQWNVVEQSAREARNWATNLSSNGMPYSYYQAMAFENTKRPALDAFRTALHDSPYNKQLLNDVARLEFMVNKNADTAIALLREAIRISPNYSYSYFNLAQVYYELGRYDDAIEVLESLDLDDKQRRSREMVWHYHEGATAYYYTDEVIDAERHRRDGMIELLRRKVGSR